jgi:beta-lactamase superfamily II metal-dependent hydrolase
VRLTVFQSDKGDCLLVSSTSAASTHNILVDGGMRASYSEHVAPALGKLRDREEQLDLVYVSHIDQDHISGVLQLFDDMKDWRVHAFQQAHGNTNHRPPAAPRPPEVEVVWHNAFHEQLGDNAGPIEEALAATATILSAAEDDSTLEMAADFRDFATSRAEAVQLSRRIGTAQLRIPLNPQFDGKLVCVKDAMPPAVEIGPLKITVIGPALADLDALREEWKEWLRTSQQQLRQIQRRAREDEAELLKAEAMRLRDRLHTQAHELRDILPLRLPQAEATQPARRRLGRRERVTVPNLASLMVLVEEGTKTLLLTGDGHGDDILKGLKHHERLDTAEGGGLHVSALKVQHHGSENNLDEAFCRAITADHYIFCGNGEHENPDVAVVEAILDSRLGAEGVRSSNAETMHGFTLWFNSSEAETKEIAKAHMRLIEHRVEQIREENPDRFRAEFLRGASHFELIL